MCLLRMPSALPGRITCEAERTIFALRRIKKYHRSTMTQRSLKSCCLLSIHSTVIDELNVKRLMNAWIDRAAARTNAFRQLCVINFS